MVDFILQKADFSMFMQGSPYKCEPHFMKLWNKNKKISWMPYSDRTTKQQQFTKLHFLSYCTYIVNIVLSMLYVIIRRLAMLLLDSATYALHLINKT